MSTNNENFRDPVGLVLRMLRTGDPAARSALVREAASIGLKPLDAALVAVERRLVERARETPWPLVLIVGPPRSGTTVLYQVLARALDVSYFTNLSAMFPRSPLAAASMLERLDSRAARRRHDDVHNYYGNTAGLWGPNDGFHVWNRWLGDDRYRTRQRLDAWAAEQMRTYVDAWLATFGRPLLNKNNRNADCVSLLASVMPNTLFVRVRRDPIFVVQSLLRAREHIQGDRAVGWGLHSRDAREPDDPNGCIDDVCDQVMGIEDKLDADRRRLGEHAFVDVEYESLCADPRAVVETVAARIAERCPFDAHRIADVPALTSTNSMRLSPPEIRRIEQRLAHAHSSALRAAS